MTGQEAVRVAQSFQERVAFDGVVLTKLDGDARGGAALSVKAVTGRPIKLVSVGEKLDQLEYFHPDRMASRILGMGDVLSLVEKAEQAIEEDEQQAMEARIRKGQFTFDDFLSAQRMLRKMGPLQGVLKMLPGRLPAEGREHRRARAEAGRGDRALDDAAGAEHAAPDRRQATASDRERKRDERAAGEPLLEARKQMEKMMKGMSKGKMPQLPGLAESATEHRRSRVPRKRRRRRRNGRRTGGEMAVRMRLTRVGSKKNPIYRVVVADSRSPRDGKFIEIVGRYNPQTDPSTIEFDEEKVKDWLGKGAQPPGTVSRLLKAKNLG